MIKATLTIVEGEDGVIHFNCTGRNTKATTAECDWADEFLPKMVKAANETAKRRGLDLGPGSVRILRSKKPDDHQDNQKTR